MTKEPTQSVFSKLMEKGTESEQNLRPRHLHEFIGQEQLKSNLRIFIQSAKMRSTSLDHILLSGPPGLGKTTLSQIIANEMQNETISTSGPLLERMGDLVAILTNLEPDQILFVDEIHRMNRQIEEVLYSAMEDFKVDILIGQGPSARTVKIELPKFTLIGATTRPGMLSNPLRDRFSIPLRLSFYTPEELTSIVLRSANHYFQFPITNEAAREIALRARGTPRIANRYLRRAYDFATVQKEQAISGPLIQKALSELGIDNYGLDELDRRYLQIIAHNFSGGPVGIGTLSAALSEDKDSLEETIEPFLLQAGFVQKTARGRLLTARAEKYLSLQPTSLF